MGIKERRRVWYDEENEGRVYLVDENLVTALVPSEIACFESCVAAHLVSILASERSQSRGELTSPGRMRRTEVWISRDEMVDFLFCRAF